MRTPAGDVFWTQITKLGNAGLVWLILTAILLLIPKYRKTGIVVAAALLVDFILCNLILKNAFARIRPYDVKSTIELLVERQVDFSFPSGHTAASFASVTALYLTGAKKIWKPALVLGILITFSRLYLYLHYPTDVLGGIAVGILSGYLGYLLVKRIDAYILRRANAGAVKNIKKQ